LRLNQSGAAKAAHSQGEIMATREEFLRERLEGLGGSDIGAIFGLSPFKSPLDVWLEKTGQVEQSESSLQMRFGTMAEQFVADEYSGFTGLKVQKYNPMLRHPDAPLIGHVDRLVVPPGEKVASHQGKIRTDRLLECKTASAFASNSPDWGEAGTDLVPPAYLMQCAAYMALTGCNHADIAVLFGNSDFRVYRLQRDLSLEADIIAEASAWWRRHVIEGVAPDPRTADEARRLWPKHIASKQVFVGVEVAEAIGRLDEVRRVKKSAADEEKAILDEILPVFGDAEEIVCDGTVLASWKANRDSVLTDWEKIAREALTSKTPEEMASLIGENSTTKAGARVLRLKIG